MLFSFRNYIILLTLSLSCLVKAFQPSSSSSSSIFIRSIASQYVTTISSSSSRRFRFFFSLNEGDNSREIESSHDNSIQSVDSIEGGIKVKSSMSSAAVNDNDSTPLLVPSAGERRSSSISSSEGFTDDYTAWVDSGDVISVASISMLIYIVLAIIGYSFVFENWPIIDSVYFAMTIFTTVGYGDLHPSNDASRIFTIIFGSLGIVLLGVFIGIFGERAFEQQEASTKARVANGEVKVLEMFSIQDTSTPPPPVRSFQKDLGHILRIEAPILAVLAIVAGPIIYMEGWDPIMGIYWMFITGGTIGFGDLYPSTTAGKLLCIIYLPLSAAVFGELLGKIASAYIERKNDKIEKDFLARVMTLADLDKMDVGRDGFVRPYEFLSYMLVTMQKVDQNEINEILNLFKTIAGEDGKITKEDLETRFNLNVKPGVVVQNTTNSTKYV